jgi:AcrR family transcriptional regulator
VNVRDADRKTRLADAAIEVLGTGGVRALTHRAVDAAAGLPQGTCSYHHPSRSALLTAALTRIADLDRADASADLPAVLRGWVCDTAARSRARFMLMLDPQVRAELGPSALRLANGFVDLAAERLGSRERARLAIALIDGLLLDELTRGAVTDEERRTRLAAVQDIVTIRR